MTHPPMQLKEILRPVTRPYLRLVSPERTPEELLDLELREETLRIPTPAGAERPRRLYKLAASELFPLRVLARVLRDMLEADMDPHDVYAAVARPIKRFIERVFKRRPPSLPPRTAYRCLPRA